MKKALFLFIIAVLVLLQVPALANGLKVFSENGDKVTIFEDVETTGPLNGNVVCIFGDVTITDELNGDVVSIFGDVSIDSHVSGLVVSIMGNLNLGDNAVIEKDAVAIGRLEKSINSRVKGELVEISLGDTEFGIDFFVTVKIVSIIVFTAFILLAGFAVIALSGDKVRQVINSIDNKAFEKLAKGILIYLGMIVLLPLLLITVIYPLLFIIIVIFAGVFAGIYFGKIILRTFNAKFPTLVEFITGFATITLLRILLVLIIPEDTILVNIIVLILFEFFVNSLGIGILTCLISKSSKLKEA